LEDNAAMIIYLILIAAVTIVAGPARADYLPETYAGCAEIKGNNPHYRNRKQQQKMDYKRCLIEADRFLRQNVETDADLNNPYAKGTIEYACHAGDVAACTRWRDRECRAGERAACDYYVARTKKDPREWCSEQYPDDAASYRFCLNGSPDR
jgi:hypothetical protein